MKRSKVMLYCALVALLLILIIKWAEGNTTKMPRLFYNKDFVAILKRDGYIKDPKIEKAFLEVDRQYFIQNYPYSFCPDRIDYGPVCREPYMCAYVLEALGKYLKEGNKVLDVNFGNGYLTSLMASMVGKTGYAIGVTFYIEEAYYGNKRAKKNNPSFVRDKRVAFVVRHLRLGAIEYAPFDAIYVGAPTTEVPPLLVEQLKIGGRMLIPKILNDVDLPKLYAYDKGEDGNLTKTRLRLY